MGATKRGFPQELNFNILNHVITHLYKHIVKKLFGNNLVGRLAKNLIKCPNYLFERFIQLGKHVKIAINISITGAFG